METRAQATAERISQLERDLLARQDELARLGLENSQLRAALTPLPRESTPTREGNAAAADDVRETAIAAAHQERVDAENTRFGPQRVADEMRGMFQLRPAPIERFHGDCAKTLDFVTAVDRRLRATGQLASPLGFEFAVSLLAGAAATWWRYAERRHPSVVSWVQFRPLLEEEFFMVNEKEVYEKKLLALQQTGDTAAHVAQFFDVARRLDDMPDSFLQRRLYASLCYDMRKRLAGQSFTTVNRLAAAAVKSASLCAPDFSLLDPSDANIHALAARSYGHARTPTDRSKVNCNFCGRTGHLYKDCFKRQNALEQARNRYTGKGKPGHKQASKGSFKPGKYSGGARVNNIEAEADEPSEAELLAIAYAEDDPFDQELRQGNEEA